MALYIKQLCILTLLAGTVTCSPCDQYGKKQHCRCVNIDYGKTQHIKFDCSSEGLRTIPTYLPKDTWYLDLSDNNLNPDDLQHLCEYPQLVNVSLARNYMTRIAADKFIRCEITSTLDLTGNLFENISSNVFNGLEFTSHFKGIESRNFQSESFSRLSALRSMSISIHQHDVPADLFKGLKLTDLYIEIREGLSIPMSLLEPMADTLKNVDIHSPSIRNAEPGLLKDMLVLEVFKLFAHNVRSIPETLFQTGNLGSTLRTVTLSGLRSLPRRIFSNLNSLKTLDIHQAEDMPSNLFEGLLNLEKLDLSYCRLHQLPLNWFFDLKSLIHLNMSNMGLQDVTRDRINSLGRLTTLDMSNNDLRELEEGIFNDISNTVEYIYLNNNNIKEIKAGVFAEVRVLKVLDLSRNQIYKVNEAAFRDLVVLEKLYINNNKLYQLDSNTFVSQTNLQSLDLCSNVLRYIPEGLFRNLHNIGNINLADNLFETMRHLIPNKMINLEELNLNYNPITCTCEDVLTNDLLHTTDVLGTCVTPPDIAIANFAKEICGVLATSNNEMYLMPSTRFDLTQYSTLVSNLETRIHFMESGGDQLQPSFVVVERTQPTNILSMQPSSTVNVQFSQSAERQSFDTLNILPFPGADTNAAKSEPTKQEEEDQNYWYAVAFISIVAVGCFIILGGLFYRHRRGRRYEVTGENHHEGEQDIDMFYREVEARRAASRNRSPGESEIHIGLKEVPSIQIESVQDDGSINVQEYPLNNSL